MDWADIGRVVVLGGAAWLLDQIAGGRLVPFAHGLTLRRVKERVGDEGPRIAKCVFHGLTGCTIPHARRPATCNYYVCESVLEAAKDQIAEVEQARAVHAELVSDFTRWDAELARRIAAAWPEGPPFDEAFLTWLGARFAELTRA